MRNIRAIKLEKYMEFILDGSLIKSKFEFSNIAEEYIIGIDLSIDANIFYGINSNDLSYQLADIKDFDSYDIIFRLLNLSRNKDKEEYILRVLKTNKNEKVDFKAEKEYLNSFIEIKRH